MRRELPLNLAMAAIAAVAMLTPAWLVLGQPDRQVAKLQAMAESSCKCARTRTDDSGKAACWHAFDAATDRNRAGVGASMCDPISRRTLEIADPRATIVLGYDVSGLDGAFCTMSEASAAEKLWYVTSEPGSQGSDIERERAWRRADAALLHLSRELARGRRAIGATTQGCAAYADQPGNP